ncbi:GTP cyclohydrolase FolE2 [Endozoicomonadaceae bacterium StTr2]
MSISQPLPDVTSGQISDRRYPLQWVGMEKIAVPVSLPTAEGNSQTLVGEADVYVSLDKAEAKGIHMSRLHAVINTLNDHECSKSTLDKLLDNMITSQQGISKGAKIRLSFNVLLRKPALLSPTSGFQSYPVVITGEINRHLRSYEMELSIPYSSTCPCSASLARQLYSNAIDQAFPQDHISKTELLQWVQAETGTVATPHSQRSFASIKMLLGDSSWPEVSSLILHLEEVLGTAVQTSVKRVDEQEFARRNALNLMFCEDAARKIKESLEAMEFVQSYWLKVDHQESLHAHNAVAIDQKYI